MKERSGNLIENKGQGSEGAGQSWYLIENTCTYSSKAGILLKIKVVRCR